MKKNIPIFILAGIFAFALWIGRAEGQGSTQGQRGLTIESKSATTSDYIHQGCRSLTFIFSSSFTGTIQGIAFAGANDSSLTIPVQTGDVLGDIRYTVTAGTLRMVYTR